MSRQLVISRISASPTIVFSLIVVFYTLVFLAGTTEQLLGDERRYAIQAENLTNGYFIPQERKWIDNGPGYPLLLAPFAAADLDWFWAKLLNPLFLALAVFVSYKTFRSYLSQERAVIATLGLAAYFPFLRDVHRMVTEPLAYLLVAASVYFFCKSWRESNMLAAALFGVSFGFLCLTKVIFGYILAIGLLCAVAGMLVRSTRQLRCLSVGLVVAAVICAPYLVYTKSLTGKTFYWADMGSYNLYWMSSPRASDTGDWHAIDEVFSDPNLEFHRPFFEQLSKIPFEERSDALAEKAIENIKAHPSKYLKNWAANLGRMAFNYPYDYVPQSMNTYFYFVPNAIVLFMLGATLWRWRFHRFSVPPEIIIAATVAFIVLGAMSLLHANARMARPPLFLIAPLIAVVLGATRQKIAAD